MTSHIFNIMQHYTGEKKLQANSGPQRIMKLQKEQQYAPNLPSRGQKYIKFVFRQQRWSRVRASPLMREIGVRYLVGTDHNR